MNRLNRKVEYSLMALKHMAQKQPGQLTTAKEVADSYHAPFDATARVMQLMAQNGLLKVELGAFGGYQITKDLSKVTMLDLIQLVQGPTKIAKCISKDEPCEIQPMCNIMSPVTNLNTRLNEFYQNLSLKELLFKQ